MTLSRRPCPICGGDASDVVLPLNPTPLGDALHRDQTLARKAPLYPLSASTCRVCQHLFLPEVVDPAESYSNYHFETGSSPNLVDGMRAIVRSLWSQVGVEEDALVVDIGSNDGAWLREFVELGAEVLGVEPSARHAERATDRGISTINSYFTEDLAQQIKSAHGAPALVTANFVTANVPNLQEFFQALKALAGGKSLISIMTGYHPDQFRVNMFDFVYHEHVSYFTTRDFINVADDFGWTICSAQRVALKGGSLHIVLQSSDRLTRHHSDAFRLLQYERWLGVTTESWFLDLRTRLSKEAAKTEQLLETIQAPRILGYGMSHSVTTLTYNFPIREHVVALVDDNAARHGLFAPGTGWPILSLANAMEDGMGGVIILAWQHDSLIVERVRAQGWSGPIIQPLPGASMFRVNE